MKVLREKNKNKNKTSLGQTQSFQQSNASNSESSRETEAIARDKAWHKEKGSKVETVGLKYLHSKKSYKDTLGVK